MLVILVVVALATFLAVRAALLASADELVEDGVAREADQFRALAEQERYASGPGALRRLLDAQLAQERAAAGDLIVAYVDDHLYATRPPQPDEALIAAFEQMALTGQAASGEAETADGPAKYSTVPISSEDGQGATVVFARTVSAAREQMEEPIRVAAAVSVVVPLICSLLIWFLVARAMAPLRSFADEARQITEFDLGRRVSVHGGDEVAELERTFNEMLDRLQAAFDSQKEFLSEVGHELRTPITIISGHVELTGEHPTERRATADLVRGELERMGRIVDDLMLLARAQRADFLRVQELDLDLLTHEIFANAETLGDRDWQLEQTGIGTMTADHQRLTQAMVNLAKNAVEQTGEGDWIALGTSLSGGEVRMWVRDSGPGVDASELDRIFERFTTSSTGTGVEHRLGLGLAIVTAIAEAHGGRVEVTSTPGSGATFAIVMPARPPAPGQVAGQ